MQNNSSTKLVDAIVRRSNTDIEYRLEKESSSTNAKRKIGSSQTGRKSYSSTERTITSVQSGTITELALMSHRKSSSLHSNLDVPIIDSIQSPTATLNSWANRNQLRIQYVFLNEQRLPSSPNNLRHIFLYRLYLSPNLYFDGRGCSHYQARSHCALNALYFLRQSSISPPSTPPSISPSLSSQTHVHSTKSSVTQMYERAKELGLSVHVEWNDPSTVTYQIGDDYIATAQGSNRYLAKQLAAEKILQILPMNNNLLKFPQTMNPITKLYQLAQARQYSVEFIQLKSVSAQEKYHFQVKVDQIHVADGYGSTKQMAKRAAAEIILEKLDPAVVLPPPPSKGLLKRNSNNDGTTKQEKKHVQFVAEVIAKDEELSKRSSAVSSPTICNHQKQQLIETCDRFNIHVQYDDEQNSDENSGSSRYQSTVSLSSKNRILVQFRGHGPSLNRAQENASSAAWNYLKQILNKSSQLSKYQ